MTATNRGMVAIVPQVWGYADVEHLIKHAKRGDPIQMLAKRHHTTDAEIDRVLWAKLGRTVAETVDYLNGVGG